MTLLFIIPVVAVLVPFIKIACEHSYPAPEVLVDKACHIVVNTAMVFLGLFLFLLSLGALVGACFCGFFGGLFLLLLSGLAGIGGLSAMWVGFGLAKK